MSGQTCPACGSGLSIWRLAGFRAHTTCASCGRQLKPSRRFFFAVFFVYAGAALMNTIVQGPWSSSNFWVTLAIFLVVATAGHVLLWYLLPGLYEELPQS